MAQIDRLRRDVETFRSISDPCDCGTTRMSFTPRYREGIDYFKKQLAEIGLTITEDSIGNVWGTLPGKNPEAPAIIAASHLDTVRCAGAFDGIAGVACALEAARMLGENNKTLQNPLQILATIEEEGTRTGLFLLGSRMAMGELTPDDLDAAVDDSGKNIGDLVREYLTGVDVVPALRPPGSIKAYIEVHDEQGPILEKEGVPIGIVENIVAISWIMVTVTGFAGHAGTVPMSYRQDAGIGAFHLASAINTHAINTYGDTATATIGRMELLPNSSNCIPAKCTFTVDVRSGDGDVVGEMTRYIEKEAEKVGKDLNLSITVEVLSYKEPVRMDPAIQRIIAESCDAMGVKHRRLDSGAGHDAMIFGGGCKAGMIFIPCAKGITHHPDELVSWDDVATGADILYQSILGIAAMEG